MGNAHEMACCEAKQSSNLLPWHHCPVACTRNQRLVQDLMSTEIDAESKRAREEQITRTRVVNRKVRAELKSFTTSFWKKSDPCMKGVF